MRKTINKNEIEMLFEELKDLKGDTPIDSNIFKNTQVVFNIIIKNTEDKSVEHFEVYEV